MIDVDEFISKEDLSAALEVIRGDKELRDAYTRAADYRESCELLLRAAREHRRIRDGEAS